MATILFNEWLTKINNKFKHEKRNVLLFLDNFSGQNGEYNLSNIRVQFFPPNTTSILQPLEQGVISVFKTKYRTRLICKMIDQMDRFEEIDRKIDVLEAVNNTVSAWKSIDNVSIRNCFKKAGFTMTRSEANDVITIDNQPDDNDTIQAEAEEAWKVLREKNLHVVYVELNAYLRVNEIIKTNCTLSDEDIAKLVKLQNEIFGVAVSEDNGDDDEEEAQQIPTRCEMNEMLAKFRLYFQAKTINATDVLSNINEIENALYDIQKQQSKITDYICKPTY
jgi:hypothetical protein